MDVDPGRSMSAPRAAEPMTPLQAGLPGISRRNGVTSIE